MQVFMAICTTTDPEDCVTREAILGVFTCAEVAEAAFDRIEMVTEPDGMTWKRHHICFRGNHEVRKFDLDAWYPLGIS